MKFKSAAYRIDLSNNNELNSHLASNNINQMFNTRHLQTLVMIADCGSFAAAADRIGLTQSAVSMQMKLLEQELCQPLFDRSKRSPELNNLGKVLLPKMREIVLLSEDLRQVAANSENLAGNLQLGVISSVSTGILPEAIMILRQEYPDLTVKIENGHSGDLIRKVIEGRLDAAIITEPSKLSRVISCRTIVQEPLMIVAPSHYCDQNGKDLLVELPFIRFNRGTGTGRIIEKQLQQWGLKVKETMELDSIEAILEMVAQGVGVAVVPEHCVTSRYIDDLHVLPFGKPALKRKIGFIERTQHQRSLFTDALFLKLQLSEMTRTQPLSDVVNRRTTSPGVE